MPRLVLNTNDHHLTIYKKSRQLIQKSGGCGESFDISEHMFDDLVMHPFTNCVGLVLPMDVIKDDSLHFLFEADIIQPCSEDVCALIKYGVRNGF